MKKRLFSLLMILSLLLSLSAAAFSDVSGYVFDETGSITGEDLQTLQNLGARIRGDTGAAICVCISNGTGEDLYSFAQQFWADNIGADDGILVVHNPETGMISYAAFGEKCAALGEEKLVELANAYNSAASYFDGAHSYMNLAYAALGGPGLEESETRLYDLVVDFAGVIDSGEISSLNALAERISNEYACDVAVAFVPSLDGKYVVDYADDFYDYNGYGYGENGDGILLLVSVGDREFAESTRGYAITAFTDYGMQQYLEPRFTRYLGSDDWAGAARQFITDAGELLRQAREGEPYDVHYDTPAVRENTRANTGVAAIISVIVGFFSGGIPASAMKRKLKSVEKNYGAANYVRGGLQMRRSDDRFLYANVHKTPIPRQEHRSSGGGGGGGSSVHFSSSGHSHGGSHGKF